MKQAHAHQTGTWGLAYEMSRPKTTEANPDNEQHRWYPTAEVMLDGVKYLVEQNNLGGSRVSAPGLGRREWTAEDLVRLWAGL